MPPRATGELLETSDGFTARVRLQGSHRVLLPIPWAKTRLRAEERSAALAGLAKKLVKAGRIDVVEKLLKIAAASLPGAPWDGAKKAIDAVCVAGVHEAPATHVPTYETVAARWTSGELARLYPDRVRAVNHEINKGRLKKFVLSHLGHLPINLVTLDHLEQVMDELPAKMPATTRCHVAQVMSRVMVLAVYPLKLIKTSPAPKGFLPKRNNDKAFSYLYPNEEATLMRAKGVKLLDRILFGVLAREGMRKSEATSLDWGDVDLERGIVDLEINKTNDPRSWALGKDVTATLKLLKESRAKAGNDDGIFVHDRGRYRGERLDVKHLALKLRRALRKAGIVRPKLHEQTETRNRLRAHDLRATFVTLALATGKSEAYVTDRTGHRSSGQMYRYKRGARAAAEIQLPWLEPLDELLSEELRDLIDRTKKPLP